MITIRHRTSMASLRQVAREFTKFGYCQKVLSPAPAQTRNSCGIQNKRCNRNRQLDLQNLEELKVVKHATECKNKKKL